MLAKKAKKNIKVLALLTFVGKKREKIVKSTGPFSYAAEKCYIAVLLVNCDKIVGLPLYSG